MGPYEIGNLCIQILTLVVLYLTLRKLKEYTDETKTIASASVEQMPRPCVVVVEDSDSSDYAIVEGVCASISKHQTLCFKNVGTGLALNVKYEIDTGSKVVFDGAPLEPGQVFVSSWSRQALNDPATIIISFESLGRSKYQMTALIEGRARVKSSRFQSVGTKKN